MGEKNWPPRNALTPGDKNIKNDDPLVDRKQIVFSQVHIKLGLMTQFVKALNHSGDCFSYNSLILILH